LEEFHAKYIVRRVSRKGREVRGGRKVVVRIIIVFLSRFL